MTRLHLSLVASDLDASIDFYTALFGVPPDKVRPDYARFSPPDVPVALALMPGEGSPGGRLSHLGIKLPEPSQTRATWQRLVEAGLPVRTEQDVTCCWAVQNKAWVTDPDGHEWEVYTVTDDAPVVGFDEPTPEAVCCA